MPTPAGRVRLSAGDLDVLTSDVGPAPANLGLLLDLPDVGAEQVPTIARVLAERISGVPAMKRAIRREGRHLFWTEEPGFQPTRHIRVRDVRGGDGTLVDAACLLTTRLDIAHPPWAIDLLVAEHGVSVVLVAHHVLTDGLHGLSMLTALADAPATRELRAPARQPPDCGCGRRTTRDPSHSPWLTPNALLDH